MSRNNTASVFASYTIAFYLPSHVIPATSRGSAGCQLAPSRRTQSMKIRNYRRTDAKAVNAFATPGGFLYVYTGLILAADTEAELVGTVSDPCLRSARLAYDCTSCAASP